MVILNGYLFYIYVYHFVFVENYLPQLNRFQFLHQLFSQYGQSWWKMMKNKNLLRYSDVNFLHHRYIGVIRNYLELVRSSQKHWDCQAGSNYVNNVLYRIASIGRALMDIFNKSNKHVIYLSNLKCHEIVFSKNSCNIACLNLWIFHSSFLLHEINFKSIFLKTENLCNVMQGIFKSLQSFEQWLKSFF